MTNKLKTMNRRPFIRCLIALAATFASTSAHAQSPTKPVPKVVLIGDSIRGGYEKLVAQRLAGKIVLSKVSAGGDSASVLQHLEAIIGEQPDVIHFNCGLHDLKQDKQTQQHQVELAAYEANLTQIVARLQKETTAALVFANTTPIIDERHAKRGAPFDRHEADVQRYNARALAVMRAAGVPVHDLHAAVVEAGAERLIGADGTHYSTAGYERLAEAVADSVWRQWIVHHYSNWTTSHPSGPEAAARYRKEEAARDALVPPAYRQIPAGSLRIPESAAAWKQQRPEVFKAVVDSLGDLPPRPSPPHARVVSREQRAGYTLERVSIDNGAASAIPALVLIPEKLKPHAPAILWLHSSTPDKNHLITPNLTTHTEALGDAFVRAGYVVLAPDALFYGERAEDIPGGPSEAYRRDEVESFKIAEDRRLKFDLWLGRTTWGMFVRDDQVALDYLCSRPEIDARRIGATGMSMGSTRAWWLAAVDERVAATVGVACLTRYQNLIAHGNLRAHGLYYFGYGLLKHFDTEGVLSLIAPRPFLALTGDLDAGSPVDGIKALEDPVSRVYAANAAAECFKSIVYPDVGHEYTPAMRAEMLKWFERWLKP